MATFDDTALQTHHEMMEVALAESHEGWIPNTSLLWDRRRTLAKAFLYSLLLSAIIAFSIPKAIRVRDPHDASRPTRHGCSRCWLPWRERQCPVGPWARWQAGCWG